jgi:hypothetical protein
LTLNKLFEHARGAGLMSISSGSLTSVDWGDQGGEELNPWALYDPMPPQLRDWARSTDSDLRFPLVAIGEDPNRVEFSGTDSNPDIQAGDKDDS